MINVAITEPIEVNGAWISQLRGALEEVVQSESDNPKKPFNWTASELQWDKTISWLQDTMQSTNSALGYWLLLWMACDITHGFWFKARDRSLSDHQKWSNFAWSCRARVGAMDLILGQQPPLSSTLLFQAMSNPLLFQLNPSIVLVDWSEGDTLSSKRVVIERAWQLLELPLTMAHIEKMEQVMDKISELSAKNQFSQADQWKLSSKSLFASDSCHVVEMMLANATDNMLKHFHSPKEFQAICTAWMHFIHMATMTQQINQAFKKISLVDEGGIG